MKRQTPEKPDEDIAASERWDRRDDRCERRFNNLIDRHIPGWAPTSIKGAFRRELESLRYARLETRSKDRGEWPMSLDPCFDSHARDHEADCASRVARIKRLCTYTPDMERAWRTIAATPVTNERMAKVIHDGDDSVGVVLTLIEDAVRRFAQLPKRTPAAKKASLLRTAKAAENLLKAIQEDPDANGFAFYAVANYFGTQNVTMRAKRGEKLWFSDMQMPRLSLNPPFPDSGIDSIGDREAGDDEPVPWSQWTTAARYNWLNGEIQNARLGEVLEHYRKALMVMADESSHIAQPGKADRGFMPFIIRELSAITRMLYGKPLDSTVALLVSALADLPTPMSRDDIRPYNKVPGKRSAQ